MAGFKRGPIPRDQQPLFPARLEDFIGPLHRVRFVEKILSGDRLRQTFDRWAQRYSAEGRRAYHPGVLVRLYIYGAMEGILSSRKLEAACHSRIDFKWLMEGLTPDHSTIAGFLKEHQEDIDEVFRDVLAVAVEMKLLKLQHVSIDGTKVEANASSGSLRKEARIEQLLKESEEKVKELRRRFEENEERESRLFAEDDEDEPKDRGEALRQAEAKLARMEAALAAIHRRRGEATRPKDVSDKASVTDPDARNMKDKKGRFVPGYNMQIAVDSKAGLVAAMEVNDSADDAGMLVPMVEQVQANTGSLPAEASADKAYSVGRDLAALEEAGVEAYVPERMCGKARTDAGRAALEALARGEELKEEQFDALPKTSSGKISREAFVYLEEEDAYRCPKGEKLPLLRVSKDPHRSGVMLRKEYRARMGACLECALKERCCASPERGRTVSRDLYEEVRERARQRLATEEGRKKYRMRSPLAETPTGHVKGNLKHLRFLSRGRLRVKAEALVLWTGYNVRIIVQRMQGAVARRTCWAGPALDTG